jgi:putative FmdB family regulatory protein
MPIYEFRCKECRRDFKTLRRSDQINNVSCPTCGTLKVSRLLSVTAATRSEADTACGLPMGGG